MAAPSESTITAEDLFRLPDDGYHYELTHGRLVREPSPGPRHGRIEAEIVFLLKTWVRNTGAGVVLAGDAAFLLSRNPDTLRAPDVAFVRHNRYPAAEAAHRAIEGPPDLAVEVLSPSDRPGRVRARLADYAAADTPLVWIVDPETQEIRAYAATGGFRIFTRGETLTAPEVLPGFSVPVADIFRFP